MNLQKSDYRSVYGRNMKNICREAEVENITEVSISNIAYAPIPENQEWRCSMIRELLEVRAGRLSMNLSTKEIESILDTVTSD